MTTKYFGHTPTEANADLDALLAGIPAGRSPIRLQDYLANNANFNVLDYGAKGDWNGVTGTDDSTAFNNAIAAARAVGGTVVIPGWLRYRLASPVNCTSLPVTTLRAIRVVVTGGLMTGAFSLPQIVVDNAEGAFDCTGAHHWVWENVHVTTAPSRTAKYGWLFARNAAAQNGGDHTLNSCGGFGQFSSAIFYSYGSEENVYNQPRAVNLVGPCAKMTGGNIDNLTSTFIAIATGSQSNLQSTWNQPEFESHAASGYTFHIDRHDIFQLYGGWSLSGDQSAAAGDACIYVDMSVGASNNGLLVGHKTEHTGTAFQQAYGVHFSNHAQTPTNWTFSDCRFSALTKAIYAGPLTTCLLFTVENLNDENAVGAQFAGTLSSSTINSPGTVFAISLPVACTLIGDQSKFSFSNPAQGCCFLDTTSGGYRFPSTPVASTDANTLDTYQEGAWTPTLGGVTSESGQTYSNRNGHYVKVGRKVTLTFNVSLSVAGTITGNALIKGLPFKAGSADNGYRAGVVIGLFSGLFAGVVWLGGYVDFNTQTIVLQQLSAAATGPSAVPSTQIINGTFIAGSITYLSDT